jgi:hypothetical protein
VVLLRTDVSEELRTSIIRETKIGELRILAVASRSVHRMLVTANDVPSSPILVTLMIETLSFSETSVLTRATRRKIPEDAVLHLEYELSSDCTCLQCAACTAGP